MTDELLQILVSALLSGGIVGAISSYVNKRTRSPESQNDLARIGNEFAAQLLEQATKERAELRLSIKDLEKSNDVRQETIDRLNKIMDQKNERIAELELLQRTSAEKLQRGEGLTLSDIFGGRAPSITLNFATEETP